VAGVVFMLKSFNFFLCVPKCQSDYRYNAERQRTFKNRRRMR